MHQQPHLALHPPSPLLLALHCHAPLLPHAPSHHLVGQLLARRCYCCHCCQQQQQRLLQLRGRQRRRLLLSRVLLLRTGVLRLPCAKESLTSWPRCHAPATHHGNVCDSSIPVTSSTLN
jgi:hypothetical protein